MNHYAPIDHASEGMMTERGEVTIPKAVRDVAGLVPGKPVRVGINDRGETVILPLLETGIGAETPEQRYARIKAAIRDIAGKYKTGQTTDDYMAELRGPYEPE
ncbi:MAG: type II toxin-antitoxin system PrlF family antitoxin [Sphingomonas sp.]|nr:type II toxin-antitoxin system PrlF family antitoxin [Sphingomonas sp.]